MNIYKCWVISIRSNLKLFNYNLDKDESKQQENREGDGDEEQLFDLDFFDAIISSVTKVPTTIADDLADNIKDAQ